MCFKDVGVSHGTQERENSWVTGKGGSSILKPTTTEKSFTYPTFHWLGSAPFLSSSSKVRVVSTFSFITPLSVILQSLAIQILSHNTTQVKHCHVHVHFYTFYLPDPLALLMTHWDGAGLPPWVKEWLPAPAARSEDRAFSCENVQYYLCCRQALGRQVMLLLKQPPSGVVDGGVKALLPSWESGQPL